MVSARKTWLPAKKADFRFPKSYLMENDTDFDTTLTQPSNADEIRNDTTFDTGDTVTQMG